MERGGNDDISTVPMRSSNQENSSEETAGQNVSKYNVIRSDDNNVNTTRALLAHLESLIIPSQVNTAFRIDGVKARSALAGLIAYNHESLPCQTTCREKNLERSIKRLLTRPYLAADADTINRCIECLISMFSTNTKKPTKEDQKLQEAMRDAKVHLHVFRMLERYIEHPTIARNCMILLHGAGRKHRALAKEFRKMGGLDLVKRTIAIHGKNTVTGGLILIPAKKTLETCWYGAKGGSGKKKQKKMSLEKMKQKL